jgi:hypothetical protein
MLKKTGRPSNVIFLLGGIVRIRVRRDGRVGKRNSFGNGGRARASGMRRQRIEQWRCEALSEDGALATEAEE